MRIEFTKKLQITAVAPREPHTQQLTPDASCWLGEESPNNPSSQAAAILGILRLGQPVSENDLITLLTALGVLRIPLAMLSTVGRRNHTQE
jgi:hypothetical protein